jgi:hypothetical protein
MIDNFRHLSGLKRLDKLEEKMEILERVINGQLELIMELGRMIDRKQDAEEVEQEPTGDLHGFKPTEADITPFKGVVEGIGEASDGESLPLTGEQKIDTFVSYTATGKRVEKEADYLYKNEQGLPLVKVEADFLKGVK